MKSKTSCFNTTIFKKNMTHYWPIWALYLCYLMVIMPFNLWMMISQNRYYTGQEEAARPIYIMLNTLNVGLMPLPVFLFGAVAAMAVFSYLYSPKNANMIHSLPVSRLELFSTNYLSGLLFLLVPELLAFVVSVLVCLTSQLTNIQYLFLWLVHCVGMTFFAYSLAVFVAMFTGQILAMPVYYFIVNYLYVGCLYIICSLISLISYGISDSDFWHPGASCILSPIYYLGNNLRVKPLYEKGGEIPSGVTLMGGSLVTIYAAAAVVITAAAYWLYKKRQIEKAGDLISIGILKPVFRWGVALCGGTVISLLIAGMLNEYRNFNAFYCIIPCIIVFGFLCFFIAEMLLQKSFRVFRKKRVVEWMAFTAVAVVFLSLFKLDAFGVEHYLPKEEEIEAAFVNMDFPILVEKEKIPELLAMHQQAIDNKKLYLETAKEDEGYYYTTFRYYLKDGSTVDRRYPVPIQTAYIEDGSSFAGKLRKWESTPEQMKTQILGWAYEENSYFSANIDMYAMDGKSDNRIMRNEELERIVQAVSADVEEGNFEPYYLYTVGDEDISYYNGITLNYYNEKGAYDAWDYYTNYYYGKYERTGREEGSHSVYITIGPKCRNVIKELEDMGIVDDTWKLLTYEQFQEIYNK